jgi:hypothetical protein
LLLLLLLLVVMLLWLLPAEEVLSLPLPQLLLVARIIEPSRQVAEMRRYQAARAAPGARQSLRLWASSHGWR